jgi:hypothetical protein
MIRAAQDNSSVIGVASRLTTDMGCASVDCAGGASACDITENSGVRAKHRGSDAMRNARVATMADAIRKNESDFTTNTPREIYKDALMTLWLLVFRIRRP